MVFKDHTNKNEVGATKNDPTTTSIRTVDGQSVPSSITPLPEAAAAAQTPVTVGTSTMSTINVNVDDEDDDDEFAHLSFDPTLDTTMEGDHSHNNNSNNNSNNNDSETVLDLQMTIAAMQTEHEVSMQRIQHQNKQQLRMLHDEIRKLHNETNVLRHASVLPQNNINSSTSSSSNSTNNTYSQQHGGRSHATATTTTTSSSTTIASKYHPQAAQSKHPNRPNHSKPQPGSSLFARSNAILFPSATTTNNNTPSSSSITPTTTSIESSLSQPQPQISSLPFNNDDATHHVNDHQNRYPYRWTEISPGQRLVDQLIRQRVPPAPTSMPPIPSKLYHPNSKNDHDEEHDQTIAIHLIQITSSSKTTAFESLSSRDGTTTVWLTEWDILHWFLVEIVTEQQQPPPTHIPNDSWLRSLLQWFYEALLLCSPLSYRHKLVLQLPESTTTTTTTTTSNTSTNRDVLRGDGSVNPILPKRRTPRKSSITACHTIGSDISNAATLVSQQHQHQHAMYTLVEQRLSHPLLLCSSSMTHTRIDERQVPHVVLDDPSPQPHSYYVQRFIRDGLFHWYDLSQLLSALSSQTAENSETIVPLNQNDRNDGVIRTPSSSCNNIPNCGAVPLISSHVLQNISVLAMQITAFLVTNPRETILQPSHISNEESCRFIDHCPDVVLINMLHIGNHLLVHHPQHQQQFDDVESSNSNANSNNGGSNTKKQNTRKAKTDIARKPSIDFVPPPLRLVHVEYMEELPKSQRHADRPSILACLDEHDSLTWMAEALNLLQTVIWNDNKSSIISPLEKVWIQTKRTATLMGILLDVLEYTILPNMKLYTHPFTMTCVRWMQRLIEEPLALLSSQDINTPLGNDIDEEGDGRSNSRSTYTTNSNYYYWRLLRTQNVTTDSTAELWQTSPTAINLLLQIFTRIVLHQMSHDHIPSEAVQVVPFLPLRDAIIRFMHCILLCVQKDRQLWEQQHLQMKQSKATAAQPTTKKRMRPILSFIIVLAGQVEIYKSMITVLLSTSNPASIANLDCGITNSYYCMNEDLYAMLKLQLEEITDDQYEKLQHG